MKTNFVFAAAIAAALFGFGTAQAAPLTVGSVTVDTDNFADTGGQAAGSVSGINMLDGSLATSESLSSSDVLRFGFSNGSVFNGSGIDLYVFEGFSAQENMALSLTLGGQPSTAHWSAVLRASRTR